MSDLKTLLEGKNLPEWAHWAAQDEDGSICVFEYKPMTHHYTLTSLKTFWRNITPMTVTLNMLCRHNAAVEARR